MSLYTFIMKRWAKPALERSCARAYVQDFLAGFEEARTETLMARGEDPSRARQPTHLRRLFVVWSQSGPTAWPGLSWSEDLHGRCLSPPPGIRSGLQPWGSCPCRWRGCCRCPLHTPAASPRLLLDCGGESGGR